MKLWNMKRACIACLVSNHGTLQLVYFLAYSQNNAAEGQDSHEQSGSKFYGNLAF